MQTYGSAILTSTLFLFLRARLFYLGENLFCYICESFRDVVIIDSRGLKKRHLVLIGYFFPSLIVDDFLRPIFFIGQQYFLNIGSSMIKDLFDPIIYVLKGLLRCAIIG